MQAMQSERPYTSQEWPYSFCESRTCAEIAKRETTFHIRAAGENLLVWVREPQVEIFESDSDAVVPSPFGGTGRKWFVCSPKI